MSSRDPVTLLLISVGIVLAASPAAVFAADIGAPTSEFESMALSYENGSLSYENGSVESPTLLAVLPPIDNIACTGTSRACEFERHVHERGRVPVAEVAENERQYRYNGRYEFAYLNGSFYRTETIEENGTTYLTHEPMSADAALVNSSIAYDSGPPAYRTAIEQGHATTTRRLDERQLVTRNPNGPDKQFYLVYATSTPPAGKYGPGLGNRLLTYGLSAVGLLAGIALIGRGQRRRLRSRWRR